jgi:hypothetical protein
MPKVIGFLYLQAQCLTNNVLYVNIRKSKSLSKYF